MYLSLGFSVILLTMFQILPDAYAGTVSKKSYYEIYLQFDYPDYVIRGTDFSISAYLENKASYDRNNMTVTLEPQRGIIAKSENNFSLEILFAGGSFGQTIDFQVLPNATTGTLYINALFLHHAGSDGENLAIPIEVRAEPKISINTFMPNAIFADAEFPFEIEIIGHGTSLKDVEVQIIPPEEITFRGETKHTFSSIDKDSPIKIKARLVTTNQGEVGVEHYIPFQIRVDYVNEDGESQSESRTVSILLRPRTFLEWGSDGGLWIGDFFLAPTVSIGSIILAPLGTIIGLLYNRYRKRSKLKKHP